MTSTAVRLRDARAGFTLIEALVAMTLMGIVLGALGTITAQWLPNWSRGLARVQRNEQLAIALDRLVADLSAAVAVSPNRDDSKPLFEGNEVGVVFVRPAIGPNTGPGLELVRISETADRAGRVIVRERAPFYPLPAADALAASISFADPVVLIRAPYRVRFAYAGSDGVWNNTWRSSLPAAVRFTVFDASTDRVAGASTATRIHVQKSAPHPESPGNADGNGKDSNDEGSANGQSAGGEEEQ
ncbi:MAG: prepilin-type N-terminal cleavage/methylation domain-containing protein [Blastochloris sp.]|nr:prepilin-type N-terminal cleavage/methylation domain-containing protein [Blastochloris sp.]